MNLRIGSRGSPLARWQANHLRKAVEAAVSGAVVEIRILHTTGDRIGDVPLARIGDKGLFTKEIDRAVLSEEVDVAIHSLKDVPTRLEPGLDLLPVFAREDPADVLIVAPGVPRTLGEMPAGARVGTSSLRRRAQLRHVRPDLRVEDLRGNLDTRLARIEAGEYHAAILAAAGVRRLGQQSRIADFLRAPDWLPATGQGALAAAFRADDSSTRSILEGLVHGPTANAVRAERGFLRRLEGGCQIPIGALAEMVGDELLLHGLVASLDGDTLIRGSAQGAAAEAEAVGERLASDLIARGAGRILATIRERSEHDLPRASAP